MNCRTQFPKIWLIRSCRLTVMAVMALLMAAPAFSQNNCIQDEYNLVNKQTLNCSANDVRVAKVINVRNLDGSPKATCQGGGQFSFIADFLVQTTSKSSRSNIGLYFATGDVTKQPTALTGSCSDNIIPPTHGCGTNDLVSCGSSHYEELDPQVDSSKPPKPVPDNCGDSSSTDPTVCLDSSSNVVSCPANGLAPPGGSIWPGTQIVTVQIDNFTCVAPKDLSHLVLPNCTSWQVPGSTIQCLALQPDYDYPFNPTTGKPEAIPGSPSKCNCDVIDLPITVQNPGIDVTKSCTTNLTAINTTKCDAGVEGSEVTYTVAIQNQSNFGDIIVDQICDSVTPGTIFRSGTYSGAACPVSGTIAAGKTDCTALQIAQGETKSCTFKVTVGEDVDISDVVTVTAHGVSGGGSTSDDSNSVEVVSSDAPSTATITKGFNSNQELCATVRYDVDVANTSGFDENLTLTGLSDSAYGDITSVHGDVVATTCSVNQSLPVDANNVNNHYKCTFDGHFCAAPTDIVTTAGKCTAGLCSAGKSSSTSCSTDAQCDLTCKGIQHTNKITGSYTGDEAEDKVTETTNSFTVNECITTTVKSN